MHENMQLTASSDVIYEIDNRLIFDPANQQLIIKGVKVELGHNETALFSLLIESHFEIVTRETILETVWKGRGLVVDETSVSQTVSHLRKHLADDAKGQRIIKTVPKIGYCIAKTCQIKQQSKSDLSQKDTFNKSTRQYIASLFFSISCLLVIYFVAASKASLPPKLIDNNYFSSNKIKVQQSASLKIPKKLDPLITKCLLKLEEKQNFSQGRVIINIVRESSVISFSLMTIDSSHTFTVVINPSIKLIENICTEK
ncbi:DNA-binding protein with winged-HTH domain [Shewanella psychrophila]|uniref:DNA-binding protein with winged-HTH domain n=1 Tax=Shewanella psychrophila TaxID=225848 RepID=A0A1S6HWU7_9GAMM|nr:winged helix-turn-helix domain-containing protein [Shewanella psychrophila]AQS39904.1 DNA-binding protein with winged-HTH domain [Shewanella psychrophila]